jgi:DNA-binding MarR family transcriptional regulator
MPSTRRRVVPEVDHDGLALAALDVLRSMAAIADASLDATEPRLSLQQYRALTVLHERGPQPAARLAGALGIAPSTLTRLADRLILAGVVERLGDPGDRRVVLLAATRRGARTAERVKHWRLAELTRRFAGVNDTDRPALHDAVARLGDVLQPIPPTNGTESR